MVGIQSLCKNVWEAWVWMLSAFCRSPAKQLKTSDQLSFRERIWVGIGKKSEANRLLLANPWYSLLIFKVSSKCHSTSYTSCVQCYMCICDYIYEYVYIYDIPYRVVVVLNGMHTIVYILQLVYKVWLNIVYILVRIYTYTYIYIHIHRYTYNIYIQHMCSHVRPT